ncbi:MAG: hypothetical protein WC734_01875 [Patescibacteria group bacterium]|jgi:hypothetical protein
MRLEIKHLNKTYSLAVWALGLAVVIWSLWLAYQSINRAILNPPDTTFSNINMRQHKLNNAAYDKVMAAWSEKKEQGKVDEPLTNPFISRSE